MIVVRIKGIKYSYLKRYKGDETAEKFVEDITMKWSDYTIKTIGIEIEVEGKENIPTEPCVFISNHTSIQTTSPSSTLTTARLLHIGGLFPLRTNLVLPSGEGGA